MPPPPSGPQIALRGAPAPVSQPKQPLQFAQSFSSGLGDKSKPAQPRMQRVSLFSRLAAGFRPLLGIMDNPGLKKRYGSIFAGVLLLVMLVAFLWPKPPEVVVVERVKAFVESASSGRYERARELLTKASRDDASSEAFAAAVKAQYSEKRIFRAFQPVAMSTTAAVVGYLYQVPNGPWRPELAYMVKEDGKWVRPFGWHLYSQLDQALEKSPEQAPALLSKLRKLDPRDPKLNGYSCEVYFMAGDYAKATRACAAASSDSVRVPFLYKPEEELSFRLKLADSYMFNMQVMNALREYTSILVETQDLPAAPFCVITEQLVQGYVKIGNYDAALNEAVNGYEACVKSGRKNEITAYLYKLSGNYPDEAIKIAAAYKPYGKTETLGQGWETLRAELRRTYGLRELPRAEWAAERISGPYYRVRLSSYPQRGAKMLPGEVRYDLIVDIVNGRVVSYPKLKAKQPAARIKTKAFDAMPEVRVTPRSRSAVSTGGK